MHTNIFKKKYMEKYINKLTKFTKCSQKAISFENFFSVFFCKANLIIKGLNRIFSLKRMFTYLLNQSFND